MIGPQVVVVVVVVVLKQKTMITRPLNSSNRLAAPLRLFTASFENRKTKECGLVSLSVSMYEERYGFLVYQTQGGKSPRSKQRAMQSSKRRLKTNNKETLLLLIIQSFSFVRLTAN